MGLIDGGGMTDQATVEVIRNVPYTSFDIIVVSIVAAMLIGAVAYKLYTNHSSKVNTLVTKEVNKWEKTTN